MIFGYILILQDQADLFDSVVKLKMASPRDVHGVCREDELDYSNYSDMILFSHHAENVRANQLSFSLITTS